MMILISFSLSPCEEQQRSVFREKEDWERPPVFVEFQPIQWNAIQLGAEYRDEPACAWSGGRHHRRQQGREQEAV